MWLNARYFVCAMLLLLSVITSTTAPRCTLNPTPRCTHFKNNSLVCGKDGVTW